MAGSKSGQVRGTGGSRLTEIECQRSSAKAETTESAAVLGISLPCAGSGILHDVHFNLQQASPAGQSLSRGVIKLMTKPPVVSILEKSALVGCGCPSWAAAESKPDPRTRDVHTNSRANIRNIGAGYLLSWLRRLRAPTTKLGCRTTQKTLILINCRPVLPFCALHKSHERITNFEPNGS